MERIFGRPIVTQEQMRTRIRELSRQIASDYAGKELVLVGVLKGRMPLCRPGEAIRIPMRVEFIVVTSYGAGKKSSVGQVDLRPCRNRSRARMFSWSRTLSIPASPCSTS